MSINMKKQDLIEMYQLLRLYRNTYCLQNTKAIDELMMDIANIYHKMSAVSIEEAHNPREAGRHRKYDNSMNLRIISLYSRGASRRAIAKETGCSYGYVQKILKNT